MRDPDDKQTKPADPKETRKDQPEKKKRENDTLDDNPHICRGMD
jgi:hypothetical protein